MKLVAPVTFGAFVHAGKTYTADKDGFVEVPDDLLGVALSHGLQEPGGAPPKPAVADDANIAQRLDIALADNKALEATIAAGEMRIAELEAELAKAKAALPVDDTDSVPVEDPATMTRKELFAYLKGRGFTFTGSPTTEDLRAKAAEAMATAAQSTNQQG